MCDCKCDHEDHVILTREMATSISKFLTALMVVVAVDRTIDPAVTTRTIETIYKIQYKLTN